MSADITTSPVRRRRARRPLRRGGLLVVLVVFIFLQRYFVESFSGAVKG